MLSANDPRVARLRAHEAKMRRVRAAGNVRREVRISSDEVVELMDGFERYETPDDATYDAPDTGEGFRTLRKLAAETPWRASLVRRGERPRVGRSTLLRDPGKLGHGAGGKQRARAKRWKELSERVAGLSDPGAHLPGSVTTGEKWRVAVPSLTTGPRRPLVVVPWSCPVGMCRVPDDCSHDVRGSLFLLVTQDADTFYLHRETGETFPLDDPAVQLEGFWR